MMVRTVFLWACLSAPAWACETALVLAMDISGSIDGAEFTLQVQGLADALDDPEVSDALVKGQVALAVVQWSGVGQQALVITWQRMLSPGEVARLGTEVRGLTRAFAASDTAVGEAIAFSTAQFAAVPDCRRRVIDLSGDGPENAGFVIDMFSDGSQTTGNTVSRARQFAQKQGIEINAIAIEDMGNSSPISSFYKRWAITKGGFVMTARGLRDYSRAIREKLLREVTKPIS